jgi:glycosyltransferase involved in cell wall biosynthesis
MDALESIKQLDGYSFEVIIVNDGSTDKLTINCLNQLKRDGYFVFDQENKGLSAARNTGIELSKGEYILPLDADNKVLTPYLKDAVDIMDGNQNIGVVYSDTEFFGDQEGFQKVGKFNLQRIMLFNYIDACALIRKSVLDQVGGFDTVIKHGMEDWEMWLRIAFAGFEIFYLEKVGFHYRVRAASMMRNTVKSFELVNEIENHINAKFPAQMGHYWVTENFVKRFKKSPFKILLKLLLRTYWPKRYFQMLSKHKIRNGI